MSAESAPSVAQIIQTVTEVQNSSSPAGLVEPQARLESAIGIVGQTLETDSTSTGMQEALGLAKDRLSRAVGLLTTAQENFSAYVTLLGGSGHVATYASKEPERRATPRNLPAECLDLASDRMIFEGLLPDGRRAADVLPDDGQTRKFEGPCPVSGCATIGTITCVGNRALLYKGNGQCSRFQALLEEDR
ncbi:MAG TPA: hypothetical protein VLH86_01425 [Patescibacteria group bacterium]|nr:hypothetical protein [Patescibacteria group bacterium]